MAAFEVFELPMVVGEDEDGQVQPRVPDLSGKLDRVHVPKLKTRDNHVEVLFLSQLQRLGPAGNPRQIGGLAQIQVQELGKDQLVELAILLHDEGLV